jgi:hypothetical protein
VSFCLAAFALACGTRDGIVGVQPRAMGGAPTLGFLDEMVENDGLWEEQRKLPGASTAFIRDPAARDEHLAELRLPGHPEYQATDQAGAQHATQLARVPRFSFGTFRSQLGFGDCAAEEEAAMAFLGFYNDGEDEDGDGIVDDLEIDAQVLCSDRSKLYLTVFTDDEPDRFRKLSRMIDLDSGELFDTPSTDSDSFVSAGQDPTLSLPGLFDGGAMRELGFEWHTDSIRFFLVLDGAERELWRLSGSQRVPQQPLHAIFNLWHPDTHWYAPQASADYPAKDVILRVDWVSFEPE